MSTKKDKFIEKAPDIIKKIMETVSASYYSISKEDMENNYGIKNIDELVAKYGLKVDNECQFGSCPVFIGEDQEDISICALCFGIIILYNALKNNTRNKLVNNELNAMINTLIATSIHDQNDYVFWPTTVNKSQDGIYDVESGTFNQTTSALSTLLICNFLRNENSITDEQLKERYRLVVNSLRWIVRRQYMTPESGAWSYGEKCRNYQDQSVNTAILPSFFCYETLQKYLAYFLSPNAKLKILIEINEDILDQMREACRAFEKWVEVNLNESDGGIERRSDETNSSFIHTCLATTIYCHGTNDLNRDKFQRIIQYLCTQKSNLDFSPEELKETYKFEYCRGNKTGCRPDTYEIMVYPVMINNICKLLESQYSIYIVKKNKRKLQIINYMLRKKMEDTFDNIRINGNGPYFVVKGVQSEHPHPIYGLYNVQICLLKILENEKLTPEQRTIFFTKPLSKKMYVTLFIIICLLITMLLFAVTLIISPPDAWVSLLFIPIAALLPIISDLIKRWKNS